MRRRGSGSPQSAETQILHAQRRARRRARSLAPRPPVTPPVHAACSRRLFTPPVHAASQNVRTARAAAARRTPHAARRAR
eukprot:1959116-Prymnesium_polylepis.1